MKTVSERHGLTTTQTAQIVQVFMDQIIDELARGNRIEFREFGIFELKRRRSRTARNPKTGASVQVPEKTVVSFKPGKVMKARVVDTIPDGKTERRPSAPARPAPVALTPVSTPLAAFNTPIAPKPFKPVPPPPPPEPVVVEPEPEPEPPAPPAPPPPPSPSSFY
ncbi:MAG: integration host factor subunit beta [Planctomycetes bacterium]|nr:integration host factor subunit beta [Planctomycetota bacterium]